MLLDDPEGEKNAFFFFLILLTHALFWVDDSNADAAKVVPRFCVLIGWLFFSLHNRDPGEFILAKFADCLPVSGAGREGNLSQVGFSPPSRPEKKKKEPSRNEIMRC